MSNIFSYIYTLKKLASKYYQVQYNTNSDFPKSKSTSSANFRVVPDSWTADNGTKRPCRWTWSNSFGFLNPVLLPAMTPSRLVKPCFHESLPILMEMAIGYHIVTFTHVYGLYLHLKTKLHKFNSHMISLVYIVVSLIIFNAFWNGLLR